MHGIRIIKMYKLALLRVKVFFYENGSRPPFTGVSMSGDEAWDPQHTVCPRNNPTALPSRHQQKDSPPFILNNIINIILFNNIIILLI
jgi:hypothetical protein